MTAGPEDEARGGGELTQPQSPVAAVYREAPTWLFTKSIHVFFISSFFGNVNDTELLFKVWQKRCIFGATSIASSRQ